MLIEKFIVNIQQQLSEVVTESLVDLHQIVGKKPDDVEGSSSNKRDISIQKRTPTTTLMAMVDKKDLTLKSLILCIIKRIHNKHHDYDITG